MSLGWYFVSFTFECFKFHWLNQLINNLTRDSIDEREDAILNLSWIQTEKDKESIKFRQSQRARCVKKSRLTLHADTDEDGSSWKTLTNQVRDFVRTVLIYIRRVRMIVRNFLVSFQGAPKSFPWTLSITILMKWYLWKGIFFGSSCSSILNRLTDDTDSPTDNVHTCTCRRILTSHWLILIVSLQLWFTCRSFGYSTR